MKFKKKQNERGQAAVEFALILPIILLIVCAVLDFGWVYLHEISAASAAREGARKASVCVSDGDFETQVINRVKSTGGILEDGRMTVTVTRTDPANPRNGDVVVEIDYTLEILTPVGYVLFGGSEYTIHNSCTMKAE